MAGIFVRRTFFNFVHELKNGAYAEKIEKINMKSTPTFINGKMNEKAKKYYFDNPSEVTEIENTGK